MPANVLNPRWVMWHFLNHRLALLNSAKPQGGLLLLSLIKMMFLERKKKDDVNRNINYGSI